MLPSDAAAWVRPTTRTVAASVLTASLTISGGTMPSRIEGTRESIAASQRTGSGAVPRACAQSFVASHCGSGRGVVASWAAGGLRLGTTPTGPVAHLAAGPVGLAHAPDPRRLIPTSPHPWVTLQAGSTRRNISLLFPQKSDRFAQIAGLRRD